MSSRRYIHKIIISTGLLIILLMTSMLNAVERAPRISDKEIIEGLSDIRGDIKELKAEMKSEIKRLDGGQKAINRRFDDMNRRFDDIMKMLQILTAAIIALLGWQVVMWRKLIKVEQRQSQFETQDDEIKFLKEAYNKLNDMVVKLMDALKPPREIL